MKFLNKAALVFGLALSFAAPALAAPPDLGKDWRLISQKKVRYFVADRDVNQTTSRSSLDTTVVASETEVKDLATKRERRDGKQYDTVDEYEQNGRKTLEQRAEGRKVGNYANQEVNTYKLKVTKLPYSYVDVSTWQERSKTRLASTYLDKTAVSWEDPFTRKRLASSYQTKVGPLTEYSFGSWKSRTSEAAAGGGEDLVATSRNLVKSRIDRSKIGTSLAAAAELGAESIAPRTGISFSEGGLRGSEGSRVSNLGRSFSLSGAQKTKASGKAGKVDLGPLVNAARSGQDLYLNGRVAFKLGLEGENVVFVPVDGRGVPQSGGVALAPGNLEGESDGVEIRIRGISGEKGRLVLAGKFRQAYLAKDGNGQTLTTL